MAKRVKARQWGDGFVFQKQRTRADGTTYTAPTWYVCYSVDGTKRREATDAQTEVEAQKILDGRVSAIQKGEIMPPSRNVRLSDLEKRYFQDYEDKHRRSTVTARGRWKNLLEYFDADRKALGISTDELAAYARQRVKAGASDSTANRELAALKHAFRLALHAKVLVTMPTFPAARPEARARQNFVTAEQAAAIRAHLVTEEAAYGDVLDFAMLTGWRKRQILGLEWGDIHKHEIRVSGAKTKTGVDHIIPIVPALAAIIERRQKVRVVGCPWVFHRNGERISNFVKAWRSATVAAKVPGAWFHDTRRSAIRNLIDKKVPQSVAMAISGHKTADVFKRYSIVTQDDVARALEAVSAAPSASAARKGPQRVPKSRVVAMGGRRK